MDLHHALAEMGHDIAARGLDQVPEVEALAAAIRPLAPAAADVLVCPSEPTIARQRAFARAATLAPRLSPEDQEQLMRALTPRPPVPAHRDALSLATAPVALAV